MIPGTIRAGDSLRFSADTEIAYPDYTYDAGWSLTCVLVGPQSMTLESAGSPFEFDVSAAVTNTLMPGTYTYAYVAVFREQRYTLATGQIEVLPNVAELQTYDGRSFNRRMLEALRSVLENKASDDAITISIAGRSITKMTFAELTTEHDRFARRVKAEDELAAKEAGTPVRSRTLHVRLKRAK